MGRRGPPAYCPTDEGRELVRVLRSNGVSNPVVAKALKISESTLHRYFKQELEDGHELIKAGMGAALVRAGLNGNVNAIRFWLLMRGGPEWKLPKDASGVLGEQDDSETVHFFMPPNGRDQPEEPEEGPVIEGEAEDAA